MKVLYQQRQASSRASRTSSHRRNGPLAQTEQVLELQRTIGNRATDLAIQRARTAAPEEIPLEELSPRPAAQATTPAPTPAHQSLPKATAEDHSLTSKEEGGRVGQSLPPAATETSSAGSTASYVGKPPGHSVPTHPELALSGKGTSLTGGVLGILGNLFTLVNKGGELHDARKDAKAARGSGSKFWEKAAGRQTKIKGGDVGFAAAKIATSDIPKITATALSVAPHVSSHAVATAGIATGALGLPISALSTVRDLRKLLSQRKRMKRMAARLKDDSAAGSIAAAQRIMQERDWELTLAQNNLAASSAAVDRFLAIVRNYDAARPAMAQGGSELAGTLAQADQARTEAVLQLAKAREELLDYRVEAENAEKEKKRTDEAYGPMRAAVEDMAGEVAKIDKGEEPSLTAIAYYAKIKNAKGATRRAVKVISGGLGVAAGIVALVALASGPAALALGPTAIVIGAVGAGIGLGLAAETGWRLLSKRWGRTKDAYVEVGPGKGKEGPVYYKHLTKRSERFMATMSFKTKLYEKTEADEYKERKSHRKLMAAALWDYATNDKYDVSVRTEAWATIEDLTGRSAREIVLPSPRDSPDGRFTNETVREGQKAAALKLFEDKLKSA